MVREIVLEQVVTCESDVCAIWKGLSDTDWLNRAMGNERLKVEAASSAGSAARYLVKTRLGGFEVTWTERPFEFEFMRSLTVRRDMVSGPVERLDIGYFTEPRGVNSSVRVRLTLWPRSGLLGPVVRLSAATTLNKLVSAITSLDESLVRSGRSPVLPPTRPVNVERLQRAAAALEKAGGGLLGPRLVHLVANASDDRVMRIRPYELADEWKVGRRELLSACLLSVRAGLLQLRWELVCPSCRTGAGAADSLGDLSTHGACQLCEIGFGLELDRSLEATFRPLEAIRQVEVGPFCVGSPARVPHVVSQAVLPPSPMGKAVVRVPDEVGLFRLFLRGGAVALVQSEPGAASSIELPEGPWPEKITVAPTGTIAVPARDAAERHVKLERSEWTNLAATARDVTMLPLFRREFSAQVLRPGLSLQAQRVALVFSDLVGSTDLYTHAGDAEAFRFVQAHFEVLTRAIERHSGAVVKTMGDAVMAVFPDELAAVAGARDMLLDFETFRLGDALGGRTSLKVGVHGGSGFVATANKVLDYFGQTVNVAARLQNEAKAGQLVVAEAVAEEAVASGCLAVEQIAERYPARLKGVDAPILVARVQVCAPPAPARALG
ncbi:MAG: adenylate/guanylate cyclase domain-containing protein [Myxococcaceae bacterium]|nr:adenylate/guanylate cyclase domain-containing protein [Myxococcaceae bacterium]